MKEEQEKIAQIIDNLLYLEALVTLAFAEQKIPIEEYELYRDYILGSILGYRKPLDSTKVRMGLARILDKTIRQFEVEKYPEAFDLRAHIDQILALIIPEGEPPILSDSDIEALGNGKVIATVQRNSDIKYYKGGRS